jgi:manganese/iron transport system ATP-binding protein
MGLQVSALKVCLGDQVVLEDVSLSVTRGELVGLVGPNGAGKTTLLRAILGLVQADSGRVEVDGLPSLEARESIAYVPQRHEFAWELPINVREAVMTGRTRKIGWLRRPSASDEDAVEEALERTDLTSLAVRAIGELSGGQRQRVLVARALALRPSLLLLDEPFSALDVPTHQALSDLFIRLKEEGCALLLTTHDLSAAGRTCTRLVLLNQRIIADGAPNELHDAAVWLRAFGVTSSKELLSSVGAGE